MPEKRLSSLIREGLIQFIPGWRPSHHPEEQLRTLIKELMRWNQRFSFTSLRDERDLVEIFILDSLTPVIFLPIPLSSPLLDAGCGPGFPSLPLKIVSPETKMVAIDSNRKKINFVRHMTRLFGLSGFQPLWERLERFVEKGQEHFSLVVTRAISVEKLLPILAQFLKVEGTLCLFCSGKAGSSDWNTRLKVVNIELINLVTYTLPFSGRERGLVIGRKLS